MLTGLALAAVPAPAAAQSGGAAAPVEGGHSFEQPGVSAPDTAPRLRASVFTVNPGTVTLGTPVRIAWRIDGTVRDVRARVALVPAAGGPATSVTLGTRRTGRRYARTFTPKPDRLAPGSYVARLHATGQAGARLRRSARASGRQVLEIAAPPAPAPAPVPVTVGAGIFPIQGPYSYGGSGARFGAARSGHVHQGQDIIAAEGTPVVTPVSGVVYWRAYQASGAGHYVVVRGDDTRDYAFMHFQDGSVVVGKGDRVAAGQPLAAVGTTGDAHGAHLHFEIWPAGWFATKASQPIDPLPDLQAWAAGS